MPRTIRFQLQRIEVPSHIAIVEVEWNIGSLFLIARYLTVAEIQAGQKTNPGSSDSEPLLAPVSPGVTQKNDPALTPKMGPTQSQTGEANFSSESFGPRREPVSDEEWCDKLIGRGVSPFIARAQIQHRRDLPGLLHEHAGAWVAYKGEERLEIGSSKTRLYRKYLDLGMGRDEVLVLCVEPDLFEDELDFPIPS
jgi:hypothetical protein